jgi:16S rRNA (guanine1207-N2)-methyltransferase
MNPFNQSTQTIQTQLNNQALTIVTRPGLPEWEHITPTQALLAEHAHPQGNTLLFGCDHGALAAAFARRNTPLTCTDDHLIALQTTAQTLQANGLPEASLVSPLEIGGPYQTVVIRLPKGRKLARRWLLEAHAALLPGGFCYLGGANAEGIQAVLKDASEIFGGMALLGYRKGCRVGRMMKQENHPLPAWTQEPGLAPQSWHTWNVDVCGFNFSIHSLPGVFSFDQLDPGSRLLLENLAIPAGGRVLDFGCGCGILGMAAARLGAAHVDMVDVNLLAVAAAQENVRMNVIINTRVLASDLLEAVQGQHYDRIITNPPFHAGHAVDTDITQRFLAQAQTCLVPGGALIMVVNRFLRYQLFGQVETLAANSQYHVLCVRPNQPEAPRAHRHH